MVTANHNVNIRFRESGARVIKRKLDSIGLAANGATRGIFLMQRAIFVLGGAGILRGLTRQLDMLTEYENRLKLTTSSAKNLQDVQSELFEIAIRSRSAFQGVADIYTRTALSVKALGVSQKETLQFTESLSKATIISGASAREANAAMVQLGQGMASNRLSGDEMRSVLEQLPFVADVIAKSLGITRGEMREFGRTGKITALSILKAFREAREEIDEKFANTVSTISQAMTIFHTRFLRFLDDFDDASSASAALAKAIIFVSKHFTLLANTAALATIAIAASFANSLVRKVILYAKGLKTAAVANIAFTKAVAAGEVVLLGSAAAEVAKTEALIASTAAHSKAIQSTVTQARTNLFAAHSARVLAEAELAELAVMIEGSNARSIVTGQYVNLTRVKANYTIISKQVAIAAAAETNARHNLTKALGVQTLAYSAQLVAYQKNLLAVAAFNTPLAKLSRRFPIITAGIIGVRNALASMMAWMVANPIYLLIAASVALFSAFNKIKTVTERSAGAMSHMAKNIKTVKEAALTTISPVEALSKAINELSVVSTRAARNEMYDAWVQSVAEIKNLLDSMSEWKVVGFDLSGLMEASDLFINNKMTMEDYITSLEKLGRTSQGDLVDTMIIKLIEVAKESEFTRESLVTLSAQLRVLTGNAKEGDDVLSGFADALDDVASSAGAVVKGIAAMNQYIPELAKLAKIQGELADLADTHKTSQMELRAEFEKHGNWGVYIAGLETLNDTFVVATSEINGMAEAGRDATEDLLDFVKAGDASQFTGLAKSLHTLKGTYDDLMITLIEAGKEQWELDAATASYERQVKSLTDAEADRLSKKKLDPTFAALIGLMEQEIELLNMGSKERVIANALLEMEKELKRDLTDTETQYATQLLRTLEATKTQASVLESINGPREKAIDQMAALNELYALGKIGIDDYTASLKEMQEAAWQAEGTLSGGFMSAISGAIMSAQEFGTALGGVVVDAAGRAADAIVEFATTGKINIRQFFYELFAQLLRLAANQLFLQLLGGMFGIPMGAGNAAGIGKLFGGATGASMAPSGPGSTDTQFVAFNKRPDERVDILTPGQQAAQQNNMNSGGGNSSPQVVEVTVPVAVVLDEKDIVNILGGKAGDTFIVRGIERNATSVKKVIGG